jgi:hypothetical protein
MGYKLLLLFILFMMISLTIRAQESPGIFLSFEQIEKIRTGFIELTQKVEGLEKENLILRMKLACS